MDYKGSNFVCALGACVFDLHSGSRNMLHVSDNDSLKPISKELHCDRGVCKSPKFAERGVPDCGMGGDVASFIM